ncbi:MAG: hypothetical protein H6512_01540 [Acidimicrobiia bacterium]|nr:hypothetical protein [Acidimicrobiia bacterium]
MQPDGRRVVGLTFPHACRDDDKLHIARQGVVLQPFGHDRNFTLAVGAPVRDERVDATGTVGRVDHCVAAIETCCFKGWSFGADRRICAVFKFGEGVTDDRDRTCFSRDFVAGGYRPFFDLIRCQREVRAVATAVVRRHDGDEDDTGDGKCSDQEEECLAGPA